MSKTDRNSGKKWLLIGAAVMLAVLIGVAAVLLRTGDPQPTDPSGSTGFNGQVTQVDMIELGEGLRITGIAKYAGAYMEDGSNQTVSGILMVMLENTTQKDLQLARFSLKYSDFTAEFEATNIPAGASVVLLERNRHGVTEERPASAELFTMVFFEENMSLMEDTFRISGKDGQITIENISDSDISGDIYVYYKNSADGLFYGGITYRAKLGSGLAAGKSSRVLTEHYDPENCTIVQVKTGD